MELGLHIADFTWSGGAPDLAPTLSRLARSAEEAGVSRLTVMDHLWQIQGIGPPEDPMLEAYTTLGYLAGVTRRVRLHALVTAVVYREPGMLAKMVTTLDVLSGGRAGLGLGAAWNEEEARGLGLPFPSTRERFERLEETLRICEQMWSESDAPFEGEHYKLARTLNSPQSLSRPRPYLMIGGSGSARRCASSLGTPTPATSSRGPRPPTSSRSCARTARRRGRDYDEIEKTTILSVEASTTRDDFLGSLRGMRDLGFTVAYVFGKNPNPLVTVELLASVIPEIADW